MPFCLWLGFSCLLLYMYTHMHPHTLSLSHTHTCTHVTICSASPVTGPQYRSIIYLRPLTLRIRSRFSPIMARLAQHPASIKAYPDMPHTRAHVRIMWSHSHPDVITHGVKIECARFKILHFNCIFTGFTFSFQSDIYILWKNLRRLIWDVCWQESKADYRPLLALWGILTPLNVKEVAVQRIDISVLLECLDNTQLTEPAKSEHIFSYLFWTFVQVLHPKTALFGNGVYLKMPSLHFSAADGNGAFGKQW